MINNSLHPTINFGKNASMKKLLSTSYPEWAFDTMMLLTRICFGGLLLVNYGFDKMVKFSRLQYTFGDPFHIGAKWSLVLVIFAEVFCALLLVLGLFTRLAAIPLVISLGIAFFLIHNHNIDKGQNAALFLAGILAILLCGPGRASVDHMMGK
jgi:putative oxidoreductase